MAAALVLGEAPAVPEDPPVQAEVVAAAVTAMVLVLCGPVVGLLWAALAPRAELVVAGPDVYPRDRETSAFFAADGVFLAATALFGVLTGLVAWRLSRRYGLGVVLGLALGGLAAAVLARLVGEAVGTSVGELVGPASAGAAAEVPSDLAFGLRTPEALVGWPVGALVGFVTASVLARRR